MSLTLSPHKTSVLVLSQLRGRPLLFVAAIVLGLHILAFGNYLSDDAGITFSYARTLGQGGGLALTRGTDPVEGYSSFLWLLMVSPFCIYGGDPTFGVKALCFILACSSFVFFAKAADAMFSSDSRRDVHIRDCGFVAMALFTPFAVWTAAGMENSLYCALLGAGLYYYVTHRLTTAAIALVGLALTRVEGVAFIAAFLVHRLLVFSWRRHPLCRLDAVAISAFAMLYGSYQLWHWHQFLAFFPNSYLSKAPTLDLTGALRRSFDFSGPGWTYIRRDFIHPYHIIAIAPLIGLVGMVEATQLVLVLMLLAMGTLLVVMSGGDFYPEFRLGTIVLPLIFLLIGEGMRLALRAGPLRVLRVLAVTVMCGLICYPSVAHTRSFGRPIGFHELRSRSDLYLEIARKTGERRLTIVESDIGNVAYVTGFPIIDLGGLTNLNIARFGRYFFLDYTFDEVRPDVIHVSGTWARQANIPPDLINRDYVAIEGGISPAGYAEGIFLRRALAERREPVERVLTEERNRGPDVVTAAWRSVEVQPREPITDIFRQFERYCDGLGGDCPGRTSLSRRTQLIGDRYERQFLFADAFTWYSAALRADPLNVRALRMREEMRLARVGAAPLLERGRFAEARAFYERLFARGWRPRTPAEFAAVKNAARVAGFRIPASTAAGEP